MEKLEIYTSKKKSLLLLVASIAFVALGVWLLIDTNSLNSWRTQTPLLIRAIGIASIIFFGFGIFVMIKRLIRPEIALIMDSKGLYMNPKKSKTDYIKWGDLLGFEEVEISGTQIIIISVTRPKYWIEKESNPIRKKMMQFNLENYDSPFNIAASGLNIGSKELNEKLIYYFNKYRNEA